MNVIQLGYKQVYAFAVLHESVLIFVFQELLSYGLRAFRLWVVWWAVGGHTQIHRCTHKFPPHCFFADN